jgi:hypothetical protein
MSRIETRIAKAEKWVGVNDTGQVDTLTDEELEELRTVTRKAMERQLSVMDLLTQNRGKDHARTESARSTT